MNFTCHFILLKDFGVETLIELIGETNFPWLMSNCLDVKTGKPLAHGLEKVVLNFNGLKVKKN